MTTYLSHYQWLASESGRAALHEATQRRTDGLSDLKLGEMLRQDLDSERAALVLTQIDLRERGARKFSRASEMLFTRAGLEQATSASIAHYRASRYTRCRRIVDLCCGIGGDLVALASNGAPVVAVDRDPVHLLLAEYNARIYNPDGEITPLLMDVEDVQLCSEDAIFIDPARRIGSGRRTGYQSEPSIEWSLSLANRVAAVGIKTAPGVPHHLLPSGWEMEHIALDKDLKEAVLWSPALAHGTSIARGERTHTATVIDRDGVHTLHGNGGDSVAVVQPKPGQWLLDVNPAVTNAALVQELAASTGTYLIDPEIGFLVSDLAVDTPFATNWHILAVLPWHEKQIKRAIGELNIGPVDIRRRGLAGDVPAITRRLRGKGSHRALIAMTRVDNTPTAIICSME